jgi:hypothetical protein
MMIQAKSSSAFNSGPNDIVATVNHRWHSAVMSAVHGYREFRVECKSRCVLLPFDYRTLLARWDITCEHSWVIREDILVTKYGPGVVRVLAEHDLKGPMVMFHGLDGMVMPVVPHFCVNQILEYEDLFVCHFTTSNRYSGSVYVSCAGCKHEGSVVILLIMHVCFQGAAPVVHRHETEVTGNAAVGSYREGSFCSVSQSSLQHATCDGNWQRYCSIAVW